MVTCASDIIIAAKKLNEIKKIKGKLVSELKIKDLGEINEILERAGNRGKIKITQKRYAEEILEIFL